jgi:MFS family permease
MKVLVSGLLALAAAMGIGRFAYTPILPLMKGEAGLSDAVAGLLAASNYVGYLLGAIGSARPLWRAHRAAAVKWSLFAGIVTTAATALGPNEPLWLAVRFVAGVASAFVLILVSSIILDLAAREKARSWPGILYMGVGIGIALTGVVVPAIEGAGWRAEWILNAGIFALLALPAFFWMRDDAAPPAAAAGNANEPRYGRSFWTLTFAYGAQGVGYIIPATFIVAVLRNTPGLAALASFAWVLVGLVAIPSAPIWNRLAARFGVRRMLFAALLLSAAGVAAPVYAPNAFGAIFGAFALGATFMGITVLVSLEARALFPHASHRAIGDLTVTFSIGQIVGPLIVSVVAMFGGGYAIALVIATIVLVCGAAASLF